MVRAVFAADNFLGSPRLSRDLEARNIKALRGTLAHYAREELGQLGGRAGLEDLPSFFGGKSTHNISIRILNFFDNLRAQEHATVRHRAHRHVNL